MPGALPKNQLHQCISRFCLRPKKAILQTAANLVTFAKEILNGKLNFLCSAGYGNGIWLILR